MGLTELRFFCLYLSHLNARDISQRTVNISIKEFENFFGVKVNTTLFTNKIEKIMGRTVKIKENNLIKILTLYSEFSWKEDEPNIITITCNDKIVPYIFELKNNYLTYMIGNIAKLNSVQKIRLYEVMKQYEKIKEIKFNLEELQKMMCCNINSEFKYFRKNTLDPAIKDINEYTDIQVSYEKVLNCRKVVALKFTITSKDKAIKNIEEIPVKVEKVKEKPVEKEKVELGFKFDNSYLPEQLENLLDIAKSVSDKPEAYLKSIYYQIKARNKNISNLYNYTLSIINADLKNVSATSSKPKKESSKPKKESSILDDYDELWFYNMRSEPFETTQEIEFDSDRYNNYDINHLLRKEFNIYDSTIYDYKLYDGNTKNYEGFQKLIKYIYDKYNVLLIDTNTEER